MTLDLAALLAGGLRRLDKRTKQRQGDGPFGHVAHGRFRQAGGHDGQTPAPVIHCRPALLRLGLDLELFVPGVVRPQRDRPFDYVERLV